VDNNTVYVGYAPAADLTLTALASGGTALYSYLWSNGATTSSVTVTPTVATTYSVTVTDMNGCSKTVNKLVNVADARCGNKLDKVLICRVPSGNPSNTNEICISAEDVAEHLEKGSYLGACNRSLITMKRVASEQIKEVDARLDVYANPTNTAFKLILRSGNRTIADVLIWDGLGRIVERKKAHPNQLIQLGTSYRPGIYFVEVIQGNTRLRKRLVKFG
jgi:hypothetical protein